MVREVVDESTSDEYVVMGKGEGTTVSEEIPLRKHSLTDSLPKLSQEEHVELNDLLAYNKVVVKYKGHDW